MPVKEPIEEEYMDVFQNIEAAIVSAYRVEPKLDNWDVESAIDALIRQYQAEWRGKEVRPARLNSELKRDVYDHVRTMCEWRLGRTVLETDDGEPLPLPVEALTLEELVAILKRIRKSIRFWHKKGGRRGYLDFISQFIK